MDRNQRDWISRIHLDRWWHWLVGLAAFLWVVLRSGTDPKRLVYPCQQVARPVAAHWMLAAAAAFTGSHLLRRLVRYTPPVVIAAGLIWVLVTIPDDTASEPYFPGSLPTWEATAPVSAVYVMDSLPPTSGSLAAGDATVPDEYLSDPAMDTLFLLLEDDDVFLYRTTERPGGLVGHEDVVVIKGNFQWTSRNTTSTDRIKGLIWKILQHPDGFTGEILVCDNTQNQGTGVSHNDNNSEDPDQSIVDVVNVFHAKGYPVYLHDWTYMWSLVVTEFSDGDYGDGYVYDPTTGLTYPKFQTPSGDHYVSLRHGVWDPVLEQYDSTRLSIFNMPVPKQHAMAGATLGVKNWIGVLTTAYRDQRYGGWNPMHFTYFWGTRALVARLMSVTFPRLTIVDASWTSPINPNILTDTVHTNMLLASTDPVAVSWYAAKFILTPVAQNPSWTDPDRPGGLYHNTLTNWTRFFRDSVGLPCTMDSAQISVYDRNFTRQRVAYVDADFSDLAGGDGDGVLEAGETANIALQLENRSSSGVTDVTVSMYADDGTLHMLDNAAFIGTIAAGDSATTLGDAISFEVPSVYAPRVGDFTFAVTWNGGTRYSTFSVRRPVGAPQILLVDDDDGDDLESYSADGLDRARLPRDEVDVATAGPPDSSDLVDYDVVIWQVGDYRPAPLSTDAQDALRGYLDAGGKLFLTGQGIAAQLQSENPTFLSDYLHAGYVSTAVEVVLYADPSAHVFELRDTVLISGPGGASNQTHPDQITPLGGAVPEMRYLGIDEVGALSYAGDHSVVFFAFGFEAIVNGDPRWADRDTTLARILDFLEYVRPACPLQVTLPYPVTHIVDHTPDIGWTHCDAAPQQSYQVQVGSDDEWSVVEMWDSGPVGSPSTLVTYAGTELSDGETYYLRVRWSDGSTWSNWYYAHMRLNTAPAAPDDLQPAGGAEVPDGSPLLTHANVADDEADTVVYDYEVYGDSDLTTLVAFASAREEVPGSHSAWQVTPELPDGATYFWRVRGFDGFEYGSWSEVASFVVAIAFLRGDANDDGVLTSSDIIYLVNYVFKAGPPPLPVEDAGDADCNGSVSSADIIYMVNHVFKGGPAPGC